MEIRVLQYFLAVAREETISKAAEVLHITQPTLSRQLKELEEEIGKTLFIRGNKKIELTKEGVLLRQRAEEIVSLVDKTTKELTIDDDIVAGDIFIGAGEARALKIIIKAMKRLNDLYPDVHFHIYSGNGPDIIDKTENGIIDFGILTEQPKVNDYNHLAIPNCHKWGILLRKDDPLAKKETIELSDIKDKKLIVTEELFENSKLSEWFNNDLEHLQIVSTYTLLYNAALMVEENVGYALCYDKLINTTGDSVYCFRPLTPKIRVAYYFIWKKYKILNKQSKLLLDLVKEEINNLACD